MRGDRARRPGDPIDPVGIVADVVIVGTFSALGVAGWVWDAAVDRAVGARVWARLYVWWCRD